MVSKLKYGNTNTFFIHGISGNLLINTDYAGTLPAFYRAIKVHNIKISDITYVLATHYHPDHIGLISELMELGVKLLLIDTQVEYIHFSDEIFSRDAQMKYVPINKEDADLEPIDYLDAYDNNVELKEDWKIVMSRNPKVIFYAHANERVVL